MALFSLTVAYWSFGSGVNGSDDEVSVEGKILSIRETRTGGHLIITLDATPMQIFLPSRIAKDLKERLSNGDSVRVRGRISEYMGKKEIEVRRVTDITPI